MRQGEVRIEGASISGNTGSSYGSDPAYPATIVKYAHASNQPYRCCRVITIRTDHAAVGLHFVDKNFVIFLAEVLAAE